MKPKILAGVIALSLCPGGGASDAAKNSAPTGDSMNVGSNQAAGATPKVADPVDPLKLEWHRLATRRFIFSQNLPLNELVPSEIVAIQSMHPLMAPGREGPQPVKEQPELVDGRLVLAEAKVGPEPTLWVGGLNPYATFEVDVQNVVRTGSEPVEVAVDLATLGLGTRVQVVARHGATDGKGVVLRLIKEGEVVREDVFAEQAPEPPYKLQVQGSGRSVALFATRNGATTCLGHTQSKNHFGDHADFRDRALAHRSSFNVAAKLPKGSSVTLGGARSYLSAGVGQADIRMITHRDGSPYMDGDHRLWFTFSARGLNISDSIQGVMSLDPSIFDIRMEGVIVFDHGDGKLRGGVATHLFYDDEAGEWRAWSCDFGGTAWREGRSGSGLVLAHSSRDPRRGFCVMQAKAMPPISPEAHEDPCGFYDKDSGKWRLVTSSFHDGIKASLFEGASWEGPFTRIAGPVEYDSTGTLIQKIGDKRWIFSGSSKGPMMIYSYPELKYAGDMKIDLPAHWPKPPGRGWPNVFPLPEGYPYRYMALMMDRPNFPGVKGGSWSYGALYLFGAYTPDLASGKWEFAPCDETRVK